MGISLLMLVVIVVGLLYQDITKRIRELSNWLHQRQDDHQALLATVHRLEQELNQLRAAAAEPAPAKPAPAAPTPTTAPLTQPAPPSPLEWYRATPAPPPAAASPTPPAEATPATAPAQPAIAAAAATPEPPVPPVAAPTAPLTEPAPATRPAAAPAPAAPAPGIPPTPVPATPEATPTAQPALVAATTPPRPQSPTPPSPPCPPQRPTAVPTEPTGPSWWDRVEQLLLDNWTGILGAVVLVTGIGFLGVYTALRVSPPVRFGMITAFAATLLGLHYYLRPKPFAARLHVWLQSSAAAVFLFACVGAVSVPGLQWAGPPLSYLLLLAGVAANLWLAWDASRESVATLHGVLSLVALAVLPHTLLTLAAAAGVTAFSIGITYRQRWKYQLLLSIISFFSFHQYWHHSLLSSGPLSGTVRLGAMGLVLLVGVAAAVVQYRKVYATTRFDALLFAAHVLNWTCLGINLYQYSTGSPWKTVPLGLGAVLTFWVARRARHLGIAWLFRTDSVISLALGLFTAFSLQGWHASGTLILLFMLLETLLVAFIMRREHELVVFQVATAGALLASGALLALNISQLMLYSPTQLYRNAFLLGLAGILGAGYYHLVQRQPLPEEDTGSYGTELHQGVGAMAGALYIGTAVLLLRALFGVAQPPVGLLIGSSLAGTGFLWTLAWWLRGGAAWFRTMHLLSGHMLAAVAILGLHEAGLSWPATAATLYLATLLVAGTLGLLAELVAYRLLVGAALVSGGWLLLQVTHNVRHLAGPELHQRLGLLLLVGLTTSVLLILPRRHVRFTQLLAPVQHLYTGLQLLAVLVYLTGTALLGQALFALPQPPVASLLVCAVGAAGLLLGLAAWLRGSTGWFREAHLLLGQLLLMVAVLGLHEIGLSWPATSTVLYAEVLAMTLWLAWQAEWPVFRLLHYGSLLLAVALPLLVYHTGLLTDSVRALLLVVAALATLTAQWLLGRTISLPSVLPPAYHPTYSLRVLGWLMGLHLLAAGGLVYEHTWAGWVAVALGSALLLGRRYSTLPGLWTGVAGAALGYQVLQWTRVLPAGPVFQPGPVLGYLLPLLLLPMVGVSCSWWEARQQHVRWPWLYLSGLQLLVATWAALAPRSEALPLLAWTGLAAALAWGATLVRRQWPAPADLQRAGSPDSYLLHLAYGLLALATLGHLTLVATHSMDVLLGWPARRLTASALLLVLAGWSWQRPPATAPVYASWRYLHPLLPEATLLLGGLTVWGETRVEWHAVLWVLGAFALTLAGSYLPLRLRRVRVYGLLLFGAAVLSSAYVTLAYLEPGQLLSLAGLTTMATTVGLFAYAAVALQQFPSTTAASWPRLLAPLAALGRVPTALLIPLLLYPAFGVLTLLLLQSFDRSILTVLLMLEVLAAFISSLLLRRQDLRYAALAGTALCFGRLLLVDLKQHGTITRAIVFILMGVLLLGMNALYARFKSRFAEPDSPEMPDHPDAPEETVADSLS
ncbi:hypothetical protein [Hymenobacter sp. HSC-4F20]|uniref:hypothetical protein n=1 Tax=Hymenobacter sp. HSC-4F20 TaxID=2864135 RepID=UPI00287748C9|nr:hypothetical protein [Hymenobacter sp. HSC-4F20]